MAKNFKGELRPIERSVKREGALYDDEECFFVAKSCLKFIKKPAHWRAKNVNGQFHFGASGNTHGLCSALKDQLNMYAKDEAEQIKIVKRFKGDCVKAVQHLRKREFKKNAVS